INVSSLCFLGSSSEGKGKRAKTGDIETPPISPTIRAYLLLSTPRSSGVLCLTARYRIYRSANSGVVRLPPTTDDCRISPVC
ncbi:MAG: hypothetical protein LBU57_00025, partial [Dysgonamonadaceae bacterium]|nr:hypothetical protein [Dysgonamonadaceae bacterium]